MLCHEHSEHHKLPELDIENSFQHNIEKKVEEKYNANQQKINASRLRNKANETNLFLPGMNGDKLTEREAQYFDLLQHYQEKYQGVDDEEDFMRDEGWFCMPCNIKDEVYSKPPSYRHVHTNKYDPNHKPPKIQSRGETCHCIGFCGKSLWIESVCYSSIIFVDECASNLMLSVPFIRGRMLE